jgi:hypothetical protein
MAAVAEESGRRECGVVCRMCSVYSAAVCVLVFVLLPVPGGIGKSQSIWAKALTTAYKGSIEHVRPRHHNSARDIGIKEL